MLQCRILRLFSRKLTVELITIDNNSNEMVGMFVDVFFAGIRMDKNGWEWMRMAEYPNEFFPLDLKANVYLYLFL